MLLDYLPVLAKNES